MERFNYPVEEFLEHVAAMRTIRQYETVRRDYQAPAVALQVGTSHDFLATLLRVQDYFAQVIADRDRRLAITMRFSLTMTYVAQFFPDFERAGLAHGADNEGQAVSESVLRAAHQIITAQDQPAGDPTAEAIIALARKLEEREP